MSQAQKEISKNKKNKEPSNNPAIKKQNHGEEIIKDNINKEIIPAVENIEDNLEKPIKEVKLESIAKNQNRENIEYKILKSSEPKYPMLAKKIKYNQDILVETKLLIDLQGRIEKIEFINKPNDNAIYHLFQSEVLKALPHWEFSPVKINNKIVKVYFYKDFKFTTKG